MLILNEENSELKGRVFIIPDGILKHLSDTLNTYNGDKGEKGYDRLKFLVNNRQIDYREMKRIKNFFDNFAGDVNDPSYILNGGEQMQIWVNNTLGGARRAIDNRKALQKQMGMDNVYIKKHTKVNKGLGTAHTKKPLYAESRIIKITEEQADNLRRIYL